MDEKTEALIRELAEQLGTTGEHLWGVLVRQAPITGVIDLLVLVAWAVFMVWAYRLVVRKTKDPDPEDRTVKPEWREEGAVVAWALWGFTAAMFVIIAGVELSGIVGAIVNPEYWALKQVLP